MWAASVGQCLVRHTWHFIIFYGKGNLALPPCRYVYHKREIWREIFPLPDRQRFMYSRHRGFHWKPTAGESVKTIRSAFPALSSCPRRCEYDCRNWFRSELSVCVYESPYWNETGLYNRQVKAPMAGRVQVNRLRHLDFLQLVGRCQIWNHRENSWPDRGFHRCYSHTAILQQWMCFLTFTFPAGLCTDASVVITSQLSRLLLFWFPPNFLSIILSISQWRIKGNMMKPFYRRKRAVSLGACTFFFFWRTLASGIVDFYLAATTHGDDLTNDKRKGKQGRASVESEKGRISSGRAAGRERKSPFLSLCCEGRGERTGENVGTPIGCNERTDWRSSNRPLRWKLAKLRKLRETQIDRSSFRHQLMAVPVAQVSVD